MRRCWLAATSPGAACSAQSRTAWRVRCWKRMPAWRSDCARVVSPASRAAVITAGAFDSDQAIAKLVLREGVPDLSDAGIEVGSRVSDHRGRNDESAVEVGEEKLGACLGAVEADDAEVFGSDLLDAGMEHAAGLTQGGGRSAARRTTAVTRSGHETNLQKSG